MNLSFCNFCRKHSATACWSPVEPTRQAGPSLRTTDAWIGYFLVALDVQLGYYASSLCEPTQM